MGFPTLLLSGDRTTAVAETAKALSFDAFEAELSPAQRLNNLRDAGRKPLMVGYGMNDGPALAAAYVAMTPWRQKAHQMLDAPPQTLSSSAKALVLFRWLIPSSGEPGA